MKRDVDGMLDAFQDYYATGSGKLLYNQLQRRTLHKALDGYDRDYLRVLFDEVVLVHETKWRTLPDLAMIRRVAASLDAPEAYRTSNDSRAITDDAGWTEERREEALAKLKQVVGIAAERRRFS